MGGYWQVLESGYVVRAISRQLLADLVVTETTIYVLESSGEVGHLRMVAAQRRNATPSSVQHVRAPSSRRSMTFSDRTSGLCEQHAGPSGARALRPLDHFTDRQRDHRRPDTPPHSGEHADGHPDSDDRHEPDDLRSTEMDASCLRHRFIMPRQRSRTSDVSSRAASPTRSCATTQTSTRREPHCPRRAGRCGGAPRGWWVGHFQHGRRDVEREARARSPGSPARHSTRRAPVTWSEHIGTGR
jgi:hypothetical protein